ncbi:MAG TPA: hypothetical protein PKI11_00085 [Candidatus Hydrogenedentes bacterium]|nr:hypothetical protein [Candidatus Hydrogenedentota bacterium]HNT86765.1 hypothetical protein [Candidatus Hydrogenedentota bacterium]
MRDLNLTPRERLGMLMAAFAVTLVLAGVLYMPAGPLKWYRASTQEVESLQRGLLLAQLSRVDEEQRVEAQKWIKNAMQERGVGFNLMTFLSQVVQQKGLVGRAQLQNQSPPRGVENVELVNVSFEGMTLTELLDFLHAVYASGKLIVVYNMNFLGPGPHDRGIDCRLSFLTLKA